MEVRADFVSSSGWRSDCPSCRLWDKETKKKLDKDRFRQGLGGVVEAYEEVATRLGIDLSDI